MKRIRQATSRRSHPYHGSISFCFLLSWQLVVVWNIRSVLGLTPNYHVKSNVLPKAKSKNNDVFPFPPEPGLSIPIPSSRRSILERSAWNFLSVALSSSFIRPTQVLADDTSVVTPSTTTGPFLYKRQQDLKPPQLKLSYEIIIPPSMNESAKPVKTHLDEINFLSESIKGYQYGVTVDPVRITSLKEVGGTNSLSSVIQGTSL